VSRNVRAANELMRAAAGQGQNRYSDNHNERVIACGGCDDFAGGLNEQKRSRIRAPRGERVIVPTGEARAYFRPLRRFPSAGGAGCYRRQPARRSAGLLKPVALCAASTVPRSRWAHQRRPSNDVRKQRCRNFLPSRIRRVSFLRRSPAPAGRSAPVRADP
jgi:hypothetical protein